MYLSHWLTRLRHRQTSSRARRIRRKLAAEHLENRTLLTTAGVLIGTELTILADGATA